jgi:lactate dehydrogenase-like 2-hydroxyacid dehydrogenase
MAEAMAADFVVVAVPGSKETHHLINAKALGMMQKTGIFVNISRGDVVDEHALIDALQQGRIAGAGLDVYEFEPKVPVALMDGDDGGGEPGGLGRGQAAAEPG